MSEIKKDKSWRLLASDGVEIAFTPVFVVNEMNAGETKIATNKDVECAMIHCEMKNAKGEETKMDMGFQELYMFVYFCANEELRQGLQLRMERQVTEIPYEVTFKLNKSESKAGMAKRLIKVPVDEITMAIVRSEAQLLSGKANLSNPNEWFADRQKRQRSKQLLALK